LCRVLPLAKQSSPLSHGQWAPCCVRGTAGQARKHAPCAAAGIADLFASTALIPASSGFDHTGAQKDTKHFPRIRGETGVPYTEMLFFDDEHKNVARVRRYHRKEHSKLCMRRWPPFAAAHAKGLVWRTPQV